MISKYIHQKKHTIYIHIICIYIHSVYIHIQIFDLASQNIHQVVEKIPSCFTFDWHGAPTQGVWSLTSCGHDRDCGNVHVCAPGINDWRERKVHPTFLPGIPQSIWMFPKIGIPQNPKMDGLYGKTLLKWMIWGYHYF